ncbi:PEP-CTERM sorting domain-containing protein [Falsiroseomonas sp. HC035]|uniref:PEP-CTERM sorting domain-containing protein n=1 Tax=Falsiroseomonas sp. HC035 TaxID=3390999 RepID=UPI003D3102F3
MHTLKRAVVALAALAAAPPAADAAAFLSINDWYAGAVVPTVMAGGTLTAMPAQSLVAKDFFGSYAAATFHDPVYVGVYGPMQDPDSFGYRGYSIRPFPSGAAGQMTGDFGCHSAYYRCLGAHTVTYTLPYEIIGLAGQLQATSVTKFGFFGFPWDHHDVDTMITYQDGVKLLDSYSGFWGTTFAAPTNTVTVTWGPGLINMDDAAWFRLTDLVALKAAPGVTATPVPEPASLALFGLGLAGIAVIRGRRRDTRRAMA